MLKKLFYLILAACMIGSFMAADRGFSPYENRYLTQKPEFSFSALVSGRFTKDTDKYFSDQFLMRDYWIRLKTKSDRGLLGKKTINDVYLAKDGYLINRYTEEDVETLQIDKNISYLNAFQEKYDTDILLIPTASEVLTEKLPAFANGLDPEALLQSLPTAFNTRDILSSHQSEYIYYKTDHHWTLLGAYYIYAKYVENPVPYRTKTVCENFRGTTFKKINLDTSYDSIEAPISVADFHVIYDNQIEADTLYSEKALSGSDNYSYFLDGNHGLTEITNLNGNNINFSDEESLLIIKDSFANTFAVLAANNYHKIYMIDLRYYNGSISSFIQENNIPKTLFLYNNVNFMQDKNLIKLLG